MYIQAHIRGYARHSESPWKESNQVNIVYKMNGLTILNSSDVVRLYLGRP